MKKQTTTQYGPSGFPKEEPVPLFLSKLTHRHTRECATMAARQAKIWLTLEGKQLLEYDLVCSGNTGLVNEVATLRSQLQKLVQLARQNEQEKATLSSCQAQENKLHDKT